MRLLNGTLGSTIRGPESTGYHSFILTTQSNQNFSTIFQGLHVTANITAKRLQYDAGAGEDFTPNRLSKSGVQQGSCDEINKSFEETVNLTNSSNIPYGVGSTNSNAFVFTALQRAGLNPNYFGDPIRSQIREANRSQISYFPGWGTTLPLKK